MCQRHRLSAGAVEAQLHLAQAVMGGQMAPVLLLATQGWLPLKDTVAAVVAGLKVLRQAAMVARVSRVFA